ncbi:DNA double-strand break repair nuclease NurA [Candidatus Woesearchaeota archaeon]|nr:DNA double-strand break repair nuclease NurA [Candidatus Woesearchaeota archaeon]
MLDIIEDVLKELDRVVSVKSTKIVFADKSYEPVLLDPSNFHRIKDKKEQEAQDVKDERKIVFVDGGNNTLLKSSNFIVSFIRLYAGVYCDNKKVKEEKHEFFAVVKTVFSDNKLQYCTQIFPIGKALVPLAKDLLFDSMDQSLTDGNNRANVGKIVDCIRRFGELNLATKLALDLNENDIILLDGTLQATATNEDIYLDLLYDVCDNKNIAVCGLAKTTNVFTDGGDNAQVVINKMSKTNFSKCKWHYYPFVQVNNPKHKADMFFAKFHPSSNYIFRFELHNLKSIFDIDSLFSLLAENSRDPVFLGYPYGLIDADKNARVSNEERNYLRTIIETKRDLDAYLRTIDAHEVLDNIG